MRRWPLAGYHYAYSHLDGTGRRDVTDLAVLLAHFPALDDAQRALAKLQREGLRRAALIHRENDAPPHITHPARRNQRIWRVAAGLVLGALAAATSYRFGGLPVAWPPLVSHIVSGGLGWALGVLLGWLYSRQASPRVAPSLLQEHADLLASGESLLLLQAPTSRLEFATTLLREVVEGEPALFRFHPQRSFEVVDPEATQVALPASQIRVHADRLAREQQVGPHPGGGEVLLDRLRRIRAEIHLICRDLADAARLEASVGPTAEWILDNEYIVESHVRDVLANLSRRFYRELPAIRSGPDRGLPRVYTMARELIRHTDLRLDREHIDALIDAYQHVEALTIGELWALPMMLRIALVEGVHRLAVQALSEMSEREQADYWANRLLVATRRDPGQLFGTLAALSETKSRPSMYFGAQLSGHLYDEEAALVPVQSWLERARRRSLREIQQREQSRQAGEQVSIANAITSLRYLSLLDWRKVFERQSRVERILRSDPAAVYPQMDFQTRNSYRESVEELARGAGIDEVTAAERAMGLAREAARSEGSEDRRAHIGTYLIGDGRGELVDLLDCKQALGPSLRNWIYRHHTALYLGSIGSITAAIVAVGWSIGLAGQPWWLVAAGAILLLAPASQLGVDLTNYLVTRSLPPRTLPKLDFERDGIPDAFRTLVTVPILVNDSDSLAGDLELLEIRALANPERNLAFSLFLDYADAKRKHTEGDPNLLAAARRGIEELNRRHGEGKFYLFHRERTWTESEDQYLGWERKRGKLEELNRLIAGLPAHSDGDLVVVGERARLVDFRFVITLDRDTQLPRDSARRMVETLAHPLNQPRFSASGEVIPGSYTIVQPRVTTSLPSATATPFSRLFTNPVGVDPYTKAVSDAYQDLAGEGSYHGKGIYDPRAFQRVLGGRFPDQLLLSHDLIEGAHVRVGLASDIELFDEFPADYLTYTRREHRWIRGDWQIAEWVLPSVPTGDGRRAPNPLSIFNRWKIFDNLRRSLVPAATLSLLIGSWFVDSPLGWVAAALVGGVLLFQPLAMPLTWATSRQRFGSFTFAQIRREVTRALAKAALLPYEAGLALDAITRALIRRWVTKRRLLEWTTAQMSGWATRGQQPVFLLLLGGLGSLTFLIGVALTVFAPHHLGRAVPWLTLWMISPLVGWWLNRKPTARRPAQRLAERDREYLRRTARRTWRYFDDFVGPETAWLPPDNYQVSHQDQLAMRTSPTNIGMWMLSALGALDFGFLTADELVDRLEKSMRTLHGLERHRGHLLNWYALPELEPLEPRYVSFVDSGNFVGAMWALQGGLRESLDRPLLSAATLEGLRDQFGLAAEPAADAPSGDRWQRAAREVFEALTPLPTTVGGRLEILRVLRSLMTEGGLLDPSTDGRAAAAHRYWLEGGARGLIARNQFVEHYLPWLDRLGSLGDQELEALPPELRVAIEAALHQAPSMRQLAAGEIPSLDGVRQLAAGISGEESELGSWLAEIEQELGLASEQATRHVDSVEALIDSIDQFIDKIELDFLYDRERRLFAVGYNVSENRLDGAFYDMLASEARLGSFVAIARGEVPVEHWLSLGRPFGSRGRRRILMSWTGTMFEYLMPYLLQRSYPNSLLEKAMEEAVALQIEYARSRDIPWGISESAFGDLDLNRTYQYRAFGVPWLGLKRGLEEDLVVAPYATMLALPLVPLEGVQNLRRLEEIGLRDEYGFFEAVDYRREGRREQEQGVTVRAYMAHHQGMTFLSLVNLLHGNRMQERFHADRRVKAAEPLLFERIPISPVLHHVSAREEAPSRVGAVGGEPSVSKFDTPHTATPKVQLLSNGNLHTMVTNAGGGYSHWRGLDITRWRADTTLDRDGTYCYLRDIDSDDRWSNAFQPIGNEAHSYGVSFPLDRAEFNRKDAGIETTTEIIVSQEDDVEIRRITFTNRSLRMRYLELTSYQELAMAVHGADRQHPAFNKMFIHTEALEGGRVLLASRRRRDEADQAIFVGHRLTYSEGAEGLHSFETDRRVFLGRGRNCRDPIALGKDLSNTAGYVLDPILSLRGSVRIPPGQSRSVSMVLGVADSQDRVLELMEKYADPAAIERAFELSWASSQLELRMLRIHPDEARRFQKLAGYMLYPSPLLRPPAERIADNQKGQAGLWPYAISGDLPIALVSIGEAQDLSLVRQVLQAHSYWRQHGLLADLVIVNEEASSYERPLKERLEQLIQAFATYSGVEEPGGIFLLSADQMPAEDLTLLLAAARVSLVAARGPLAQQLSAPIESPEWPERLTVREMEREPSAPLPYLELPYFNSLGGFTEDGREYVIYLGPNAQTPAPWINVMANPQFGTLVSEAGAGCTWFGNSQRNRLTAWSNDPVVDPTPEAIYLRDEESGTMWSPTARPIRGEQAYRARHGAGYSIFEHNSHGFECELTVFVPVDDAGGDPIKVSRLRLRNDSAQARQLSMTYYVEWTLGEHREETQAHIVTDWDEEAGVIMARNRYHREYGDRVAFATISPAAESHSADRAAFLGRNGSMASPAALERVELSGRVGGGLDPCSALQTQFEIGPGESRELLCLLGHADSEETAHQLANRYRELLAVGQALEATKAWWDALLGAVHVQTPELSTDFLLNRWLLYQSLSCRIWGRSAFYQSGGAFGFRDQLQDVLAFLPARPGLAREHLLRAARHQFKEGDVQHWWHPPEGDGIRSRISDDLLWLPYATWQYVRATGDTEILKETVPFLEGRPLEEDEQEAFLQPARSAETGTLFEHCQRALSRGLTAGPRGLPLMGAGDWNDGMNRVGAGGRGESVWLAWFVVEVLRGMAELSQLQGQERAAESYQRRSEGLVARIEEEAWDGAWYRRAYFDNGKPLGSSGNKEGWIDSLPQSWAWIAGSGDKERAERALEAAWRHLVRPEEQLIQLLRPPFDEIEPSPGYIRAYPPGVRENGGQYTHAAIWLAIAAARSGDGGRAAEALRMLNPIEHAKDGYGLWRYTVEPYVVAADVYRLAGRVGQGGWSWYTGSAAWMYRAWLEEVLGLQLRGDAFRIDPTIPSWWEGFSLRYRHRKAVYWIEVHNPDRVSTGVASVKMDGRPVVGGRIPLEGGPIKHRIQVRMGQEEGEPDPKEGE